MAVDMKTMEKEENGRKVVVVGIKHNITGEKLKVKAYGDVRICAYSKCGNKLRARSKLYCSRRCSSSAREEIKRGEKY